MDPDEVESYIFVDIKNMVKDTQENSDKYTGTTKLIAEEYAKRYL